MKYSPFPQPFPHATVLGMVAVLLTASCAPEDRPLASRYPDTDTGGSTSPTDTDSFVATPSVEKKEDSFAWAQPSAESNATDTHADSDIVFWQIVTDKTWEARGRTFPLLFADDQHLWVIEGYRKGKRLSDIWRLSKNGTWHLASWSDSGAFSEPFAGSVGISFHGSFFLIGGAAPADVDKPTKGRVYRFDPTTASFVLLTEEAPFGPVSFPAATTFNDYIWVLGGRLPDGSYPPTAWRSSDGVSWEAASYPPTAGRQGIALASFNGRLWFIGGESEKHLWRDVWSTPDGMVWEQTVTAAPFAPGGGVAMVLGDRLFRIAIFAKESRDVWSSTDGISWSRDEIPVTSLPFGTNAVSFDNALYLVGGDDSWFLHHREKNTERWHETTRPSLFPPVTHITVGEINGRFIAVLNELISSSFQYGVPGPSQVWASTDGVSWHKLSDTPPFAKDGARTGHTLITFKGSILLIGGMITSLHLFDNTLIKIAFADIWKTTDGIEWTLVTPDGGFPPRHGHRTTIMNDRIWLVGGYDQEGDALSDVWFSDDGTTFHCALLESPFPARGEHDLVAFNNTLWIINGKISPYERLHDIWRSSDGFAWE